MTDPTILIVDVRRPEMSANDQRRLHWSKVRKAKALMETQVWAAAKQAKVPHQTVPVTITVTWYPPDLRYRDHDSLGPFMKAAQDALVKAGVLDDDDSRHVTGGFTQIGDTDRNNPRIEIEIRPTQEGTP